MASVSDEGAGLRIGSWPGREFPDNRFLPILLGSLERAGARIVDAPTLDPDTLGKMDALLIHWPEKAFWGARSGARMAIQAARVLTSLARRPAGLKLIWIVHNLRPHERDWRRRLIWPPYAAALGRLVDGFMTLSPATLPIARANVPGMARKPSDWFWHPAYDDPAPDPTACAAARAAFGVAPTDRLIGFCGQIRPYKGVEELAEAFAALEGPDLRLLISGRCADPTLAARLHAVAQGDPRIRLAFGDLPAARFGAFVGACNLIAAPQRGYLHSGSLVHALSLGRPVFTPETPFSEALRAALPSGWLRLWRGALTPALIEAALSEDAPPPCDLAPLAPEAAAARILGFCAGLAAT